MAEPRAFLDTDTLSAAMRGAPAVIARARDYLREHGRFSISIITRYEVLRGLKAKNANAQIEGGGRAESGNRRREGSHEPSGLSLLPAI